MKNEVLPIPSRSTAAAASRREALAGVPFSDVAEALKDMPCWQTMIDDLLRKWIEGGVRFVRPGQDDENSATPEAAE